MGQSVYEVRKSKVENDIRCTTKGDKEGYTGTVVALLGQGTVRDEMKGEWQQQRHGLRT